MCVEFTNGLLPLIDRVFVLFEVAAISLNRLAMMGAVQLPWAWLAARAADISVQRVCLAE
jgi:hypothetical protein